jgi:hypothetical protein
MECDRWTSVGNTAWCFSRDYRHCCEHREHTTGCWQHRQNFACMVPTNNGPCESLHVCMAWSTDCLHDRGFWHEDSGLPGCDSFVCAYFLMFWRIIQNIRNCPHGRGEPSALLCDRQILLPISITCSKCLTQPHVFLLSVYNRTVKNMTRNIYINTVWVGLQSWIFVITVSIVHVSFLERTVCVLHFSFWTL